LGKEKSRREYLTLSAVNPSTGESCGVLISFDRMQAVARRGLGHAKECAFTVPHTLARPTAIFEGLRRDEDEDLWGCGWRCYCAIPASSFRADGTEAPAYPGQVYLVFVNDEGIAYNWRWEKSDPDDSRLPMNYQVRFKRRLL
jgi:hypothetical protein